MIKTIAIFSALMLSCTAVNASGVAETNKLDSHVESLYQTRIIANKEMIFSDKKPDKLEGKREGTTKRVNALHQWNVILSSVK